jgi:hypothetical protein
MGLRGLNKRETAIYQEAQRLLQEGVGAIDFSEAFFGPQGRLADLYETPPERAAAVKSALYQWLQQQVARLRHEEVDRFEREVAGLSGRLTIQVPRSMHAALKQEAALEGVSLSELIRLKLGVPYRMSADWLAAKPNAQPRTAGPTSRAR